MREPALLPATASCRYCGRHTTDATVCDGCAVNDNRTTRGLPPLDHMTGTGAPCSHCFPESLPGAVPP